MNITEEKIDEVTSVFKVEILKEDYFDTVEKKLKEYHKTAVVHGFRPGKVPFSLIRNKYRKGTVTEEINRIAYESMHAYIEQNKLDILGRAYLNWEKFKIIDWDKQTDFEIYFDVALRPQFQMEPLESMEEKYYNILPPEEEINKVVSDMQRRYGKFVPREISAEDDVINAELTELDESGNPIEGAEVKKGSIALEFIRNDEARQKFFGLKENDSLVVDMIETFRDHTEISYILGIEKSKVAKLKNKFRIDVKGINHLEPSNLDEEFYGKIFKDSEVTNEEQFRAKIKAELQRSYIPESDSLFVKTITDRLYQNTNVVFNDELLRRFMAENKHEGLKSEITDFEFEYYKRAAKRQMIENKLQQAYNVSVSEDEIKEYVKDYIRRSIFAGNDAAISEEQLETMAKNFISKEEEKRKLGEEMLDRKMTELYKSTVKLLIEDITYEDFLKLPVVKQAIEFNRMQRQQHDHDHEHDHEHDHDHNH